jgi:hypothetical protein
LDTSVGDELSHLGGVALSATASALAGDHLVPGVAECVHPAEEVVLDADFNGGLSNSFGALYTNIR